MAFVVCCTEYRQGWAGGGPGRAPGSEGPRLHGREEDLDARLREAERVWALPNSRTVALLP